MSGEMLYSIIATASHILIMLLSLEGWYVLISMMWGWSSDPLAGKASISERKEADILGDVENCFGKVALRVVGGSPQ